MPISDEHGAGFQHVAGNEPGFTDSDENRIGCARMHGKIAGLMMTDSDRCTLRHKHEGYGFADDRRMPDDGHLEPRQIGPGRSQKVQEAAAVQGPIFGTW